MKRKWNRREFSKLAAMQLGMASMPSALGSAVKGGKLPGGDSTATAIESSFSPREGKWKIAWPERLSQHDVVYLSPPEDPTLGLPIGNGDMGALVWTTDRELVLAINKCDTWDDEKGGSFHNWGRAEEENYTSLRHCARLVIALDCPVFDPLYQQDFQGRLDLAAAVASLQATTPFGKVSVSSYLSADPAVLVVRCETSGSEAYSPRVKLERWGSRVFGHWYSQVVRDPTRGLEGTETTIEQNRIVIQQQLRTLSFVVAAQVVPDGQGVQPQRLHSRGGAVDLPAKQQSAFTIFVTAVTSENNSNPRAEAHRILDRATAQGEAVIRQKHEHDWREFWSRSMIALPEKYLENYWYLNLYLANSGSRGAYPPHFCNGLWGWNRDFVPWVYYFHWNMQWYAWPLQAANHAELAQPYFRYRRAQLPHAGEFASQELKKPGAFFADVADRHGYNDTGTKDNRTPGAQIALDFWRQYIYTGNEVFLRDAAWPVIREVTRFNAACLHLGPDGRYHISGTSAYEGSPLFDDTITDLAMIRALFPVAIRVGKIMANNPDELQTWQKMLDNLAPFHLAELSSSEYERRGDELVHRSGLAPGKQLASRQVYAVGCDSSGKWIRNRYAPGSGVEAYYGIPDPEIAPVFPAGVIGLANRDSDLFKAAVTQLRLHPKAEVTDPKSLCKSASMTGEDGIGCMGWCPYPIALARLGLAEELVSELINSVSTYQFYPQGFGHYGPYFVFKRDQEFRWNQNLARDASGSLPEKQASLFPFPTWPFRHFDNETMPIVACAINEMLIQSCDDTIRICPSVPSSWNVRFDLAAAGGFRISAEQKDGRVVFVSLESRLGGQCRIVHPWPSEGPPVCLEVTPQGPSQQWKLSEEVVGPDRVFHWDTVAGHRYLLVRSEADLQTWKVTYDTPERRPAPRTLKQAKLGRERLF
jgi:alpha-L-fucosidase 2